MADDIELMAYENGTIEAVPYEDELIEIEADDVALDDVAVDQNMELDEEQAWAYKLLRRAATLRGVTIHRDTFLRTELSKKCSPEVVAAAIATNPQKAGVSLQVMDELADAAISIETRKVTGLSALAGLPGGLALVGTIPADIVQYFAHSLRIEQKLAYIYGWESFLNEEDEVDDETMYRLILFLGVMMQVGSTANTLTKFAAQTAKAGVARAIEKQALTKTAWYLPLRRVLKVIGVNMTKKSLAETVAKGVPVVGGVISGGLTYATFRPGAVSLKKYLRTLPQATGIVMSEEEMEETLKQIESESKLDFAAALGAAKETAGTMASKAADIAGIAAGKAGELAGATVDRAGAAASIAGEYAGVAAEKAGTAAKAAASGIKRGLGGLGARFVRQKKASDQGSSVESAASELRALKELLDEGILTQEEFDAKKREILGL